MIHHHPILTVCSSSKSLIINLLVKLGVDPVHVDFYWQQCPTENRLYLCRCCMKNTVSKYIFKTEYFEGADNCWEVKNKKEYLLCYCSAVKVSYCPTI